MAVRIQWRRGEASEWSGVNPILASGEVGFETDSLKFKVGDGETRWNDLDYYATGTITGVVAGTGLVGGGYSGIVTLALDGTAITTDFMAAKGDLITALGDNLPTLLPVGTTDTEVLQVASAEPTGLKYGQVQTTAIANDAVTEDKILDTSVTTNKIANSSVTGAKIASGSITSTKIATNAVTEDKIAAGAVTTTKIANDSINTAQIVDNAVTGAKFADNSVTSAKIANNTIINQDINDFANIGLTKLATGPLPTAITVTTDNYIDRSVGITKLNNTVGSEGVGVWQSWTPTVTGSLAANQWVLVYAKYMRLNNTCLVQAAIRLQNLAQDSGGRKVNFSLPIAPAFASSLVGGEAMVVGTFLHQNVDATTNGTVGNAVYKGGVIQHWFSGYGNYNNYGGNLGLAISETGDILSFNAMYEVV